MKFKITLTTNNGFWYTQVSDDQGKNVIHGRPSFLDKADALEFGQKTARYHVERLAEQAQNAQLTEEHFYEV